MKRHLRKETIDAIRKLTPMDDLLFANIYHENVAAMNELLRVCLGDESISVQKVLSHAYQPNLGNLEPEFDVLATDSTGRIFEVEVQKTGRRDLLKRASFYASLLQARAIRRGERNYNRIMPVYVVFITQGDYWHTGEDRVDICTHIEQTGLRVDDGRHLVFINGKAKGESGMARMMHDFKSCEAGEMVYTELRKSVDRLKNTEEGMEHMGGNYEDIMNRGKRRWTAEGMAKGMEEGLAKGREKGIVEGLVKGRDEANREIAIRMRADSMPIETIARYTGLSAEYIAKL